MTLVCAHVFLPHWRMESPLNKLFIPGEDVSIAKRMHVLKSAESHRCEADSGNLACNFGIFFKVSQRVSF